MLSRRQVRIKVMQALYSYYQNKEINLSLAEKELLKSVNQIYDLYLFVFSLLVDLQNVAMQKVKNSKKKNLLTESSSVFNLHTNFIDNVFLRLLGKNLFLNEYVKQDVSEITKWLFNDLEKLELYAEYLGLSNLKFTDHKKFTIKLFDQFIAPNTKLHQYFEEISIYWADDISTVNFLVLKTLKGLKEKTMGKKKFPPLFKNKKDKDFSRDLFSLTLANDDAFNSLIMDKAENWKMDRIALIDMILMKMALAEVTSFSEIPVKVSLNEYIDISKEYSTPKSQLFVNGVLDKIILNLNDKKKIKKVGRGLL